MAYWRQNIDTSYQITIYKLINSFNLKMYFEWNVIDYIIVRIQRMILPYMNLIILSFIKATKHFKQYINDSSLSWSCFLPLFVHKLTFYPRVSVHGILNNVFYVIVNLIHIDPLEHRYWFGQLVGFFRHWARYVTLNWEHVSHARVAIMLICWLLLGHLLVFYDSGWRYSLFDRQHK